MFQLEQWLQYKTRDHSIRTRPKLSKFSEQDYMKWKGIDSIWTDQSFDQSSDDRSELIRTYKFPQGRVTDHRVGITHHSIEDVMEGESLDIFINALLLQEEMDAIASFAS